MKDRSIQLSKQTTLPFLSLFISMFMGCLLLLVGCVEEDVINPNTNPPVISSISPASAIAGSEVTISGSKFTDVYTVQFNGITGEIVSSTDQTIVVKVPYNARNGAISVETKGGTSASSESFTKLETPVITAFAPASGKPGDQIAITGTALNNVTGVSFNGQTAAFTAVDATRVTALVPAGATTGKVTIVTTVGQATSTTDFRIISADAPVVTGLSPRSAETGDEFVITGQSLENASQVMVGNVAAQIVANTGNSITAKVMAGTPLGLKTIAVTTPGGVFTTNAANQQFYVIQVFEVSNTFDRPNEPSWSASNAPNGEFDPAKTGISSAIGITSPPGISGDFYHIEGVSKSAVVGTLTSILQPGTNGAIYQTFFSGAPQEYYLNVATHFNGTEGTGDTGRFRLRFTGGDSEFSLPNGSALTSEQRSGWYNWSVPFSDFGNIGNFDLKTFERYALVVRRAGDNFYEWNLDNVFITRGGPMLK